MKRVILIFSYAAAILTFNYSQGQVETGAGEITSPYEELPELKASEILKPEVLKGPHHNVRESVPTWSGSNQFTIDSDYGVFLAEGNGMLLQRIREIYAIAALKDVSRTDEFKKSLVTAAKAPIAAAKNIVADPAQTLSNVPKGIMKFMGQAGETLKGLGKKEKAGKSEGSTVQQMIGYSGAKRRIAVSMGIDPYSSNIVLQKELDDVAWASWAGGFAFSAATFPVGGPAAVALTVTGVTSTLNDLVTKKSPADLRAANRQGLIGMGASPNLADRFLNNNAFSPTQATAFVLTLRTLDGVSNRSAFIRAAAEQASTEADATFCLQTASLMSQLHKTEKPLSRIVMIGNFPVCVAKDDSVVVAVQWDYAAWTAGAAAMTSQIEKVAAQTGETRPVLVALSGEASRLLQTELQKRHFTLRTRVSPGPLK